MTDTESSGKMGRTGRVLVVAVLFGMLMVSAAPAAAQELAPPKLTISAGYQYMNDPSWDTYLKFGWTSAVTFKLNERTFVVGEASFGFGQVPSTSFNIERWAFLGGIKAMAPGDGPRIFVQVLGGLSRQAGDVGIQNGYIIQSGGGVEWVINERFNGRVGGDYRYLREDGQNHHGFRAHGSLVLVLWR